MRKYLPNQLELKWQKKWAEDNLYKFDPKSTETKYYNLVELPYTSGDLHIGHWFTFTPPDAYARFKKMKGFNVFFPNGYDAFGLPAENAAIKRNLHPLDWTLKNIETMQNQFYTMGTMIDWDYRIITCLPEYYKWNQWIFIKMFEKGIAYLSKALSNWCPVDETVLADENVEGGRCWRCGTEIVKKEVEQWFLKITAYADRLMWRDFGVDWPKSVKEGQNNWIGKKTGINITYQVEGSKEKIVCFTTRPDTNFGATFIAIAPEHPIVAKITTADQKKEVNKYIKASQRKTELERQENRDKTGVFTGAYATNKLTGYKMPIWVADFVLMEFGTGAVVGVPGHDKRDFEFAQKHDLKIIRVVAGRDGDKSEIKNIDQVQEEEGAIVNSDFLNGLDIHKATAKMIDYLEQKGWGERKVEYHIHDWSISRQRYWGTPVPIIHCPSCGLVPVPEEELPLELPYDVDFTPKGKPPLATNEAWMKTKCPKCGGDAVRDAQTLDGFFDNSWYFLRYLDPKYDKAPFDKSLAKRMMPLDIYFGGAEHTLGHTLYARFFTKFFKDLGLLDIEEFASKRVQHGVVLGPDGHRMSKSRGNVINPDDLVKQYGADTVRVYLSFLMPYIETVAPWSTTAIFGVFRFLKRIWELYDKVEDYDTTRQDNIKMHQTIKRVEDSMEQIHFNVSVAALMEWLNYLSAKDKVSKEEYKTFLLLLAPFAPFITEELWYMLGEKYSIHQQNWPKYDQKYLEEGEFKIVIQINGKLRDTMMVEKNRVSQKEAIEREALEREKVKKYLDGKSVKRSVYILGKILNFVV